MGYKKIQKGMAMALLALSMCLVGVSSSRADNTLTGNNTQTGTEAEQDRKSVV